MKINGPLATRLLSNRLDRTPTMLVAPVGTGKSLLARRLSLGGVIRAPHRTISKVGLLGNPSTGRAGETTLAHGGVLFLDEFPEFRSDVIQGLAAQHLDPSGSVKIALPTGETICPEYWILAAMETCACGREGSPSPSRCVCNPGEKERYIERATRYMNMGFGFDVVRVTYQWQGSIQCIVSG
jgi:predicted ATPase with chaperone activity